MNLNNNQNTLSESTGTSSFDMISSVIPLDRGDDDTSSDEKGGEEGKEEDSEGGEGVEGGEDTPATITPKAPKLTPAKEESKEESKEEEEEGEDSVIVSALSSKFGELELDSYDFETEEEAVLAYSEALGKREKALGRDEGIQELFGTFPELAQLADHLNKGLSLNSFMKEVQKPSFVELDLEKAEEKEKIDIIRRASKQKGMDDDDIEDLIESIKDKGTVDDRALKSQTFLKSTYEKEINAIKAQEQEATKEAKEKEAKTSEIINKVFASGDVGVAKLSTEQTKTLKEFVEGKDDKGVSTRDKAWKSLSIEKLLFLDYMIATDFKDIKSFAPASNKAEAKQTKGVKIKKSSNNRVDVSSNSKSDSPLDMKKLFGQG